MSRLIFHENWKNQNLNNIKKINKYQDCINEINVGLKDFILNENNILKLKVSNPISFICKKSNFILTLSYDQTWDGKESYMIRIFDNKEKLNYFNANYDLFKINMLNPYIYNKKKSFYNKLYDSNFIIATNYLPILSVNDFIDILYIHFLNIPKPIQLISQPISQSISQSKQIIQPILNEDKTIKTYIITTNQIVELDGMPQRFNKTQGPSKLIYDTKQNIITMTTLDNSPIVSSEFNKPISKYVMDLSNNKVIIYDIDGNIIFVKNN